MLLAAVCRCCTVRCYNCGVLQLFYLRIGFVFASLKRPCGVFAHTYIVPRSCWALEWLGRLPTPHSATSGALLHTAHVAWNPSLPEIALTLQDGSVHIASTSACEPVMSCRWLQQPGGRGEPLRLPCMLAVPPWAVRRKAAERERRGPASDAAVTSEGGPQVVGSDGAAGPSSTPGAPAPLGGLGWGRQMFRQSKQQGGPRTFGRQEEEQPGGRLTAVFGMWWKWKKGAWRARGRLLMF